MTQPKLETYAVSVFDALNSQSHFVSVDCDSTENEDILVMAFNIILEDDLSMPLTREYIAENVELFADFAVVSIIKTKEKNLYELPELPASYN